MAGRKAKANHGKKWSWKQVISHNMKAKIEAEVKRISGAQPGSKAYLTAYQAGLTTICNGLTEDQLTEVKKQVEEWNNKSVPVALQRR